jgi:transposase
MKELRKEAIIDREVRYPPLSPEQRRVEREWKKGGKEGLSKAYQPEDEK